MGLDGVKSVNVIKIVQWALPFKLGKCFGFEWCWVGECYEILLETLQSRQGSELLQGCIKCISDTFWRTAAAQE